VCVVPFKLFTKCQKTYPKNLKNNTVSLQMLEAFFWGVASCKFPTEGTHFNVILPKSLTEGTNLDEPAVVRNIKKQWRGTDAKTTDPSVVPLDT
jgi:hypothetical protein